MHCGQDYERYSRTTRYMCAPCSGPHLNLQRRAMSAVSRAVRRGDLPPAKSLQCLDCGTAAKHYDHRDYSKPLTVEPVCGPCNHKRGPAVWGN